ncbi:MAG TPA: SGNH/GDSL hydrolase family protein [Phycisphaeraceae bacterium]
MSLPCLFVLGDSISVQYGPHLERMLQGVCRYTRKTGEEQARKNLDVPRGANGGDSRMCLTFLRSLERLDADVMLLNCGLHDIKSPPNGGPLQVPMDEYERNLHALVARVAQLGPDLIWVRTTPVDESQHNTPEMGFWRFNRDVDAYNAIADAVMAQHNVPVADLHTFTRSLGPLNELLHDGRHYIEPVQKLQAAFLAGYVQARLQSRRG